MSTIIFDIEKFKKIDNSNSIKKEDQIFVK
jgi:hypothetical protein